MPAALETDGGPELSLDGGPDAIDPTEASPASDAAISPGSGPEAGEGGTSTASCATLPLCDDFEGDTPGMPPSAALWTLRMGCPPGKPNVPVDGGLVAGIVNSVAHSGMNSLRVVGGDSCGYYVVNTSAFANLLSQVYARFWARFSGPATQNHNGFLSLHADRAMDQLRLGFQGNVVDWNYSFDDSTLPDIDPMGEVQSSPTHVGQWDCIEFHLDQTNGHIEFWLNNLPVPGLGYDGTSTQGVNDQWYIGGPKSLVVTDFGLGWLGLNDQYTAWFDDVALSGARIGCR